ncbi:hypothetical protein EVAR_86740_1 [Eumeta japonica]|uniref:Uncharacterized protein n=1 Tax=Eumeta variegata TaxID=151549 RepID=A0A4C1VZQ4_EUMVA|nr:hypothetical protein EVAR_86740_1 [Eumeta japonica]
MGLSEFITRGERPARPAAAKGTGAAATPYLREIGSDRSGNFDIKNEPRSGRPVTDKVDAMLAKVEQERHIGPYGN